MKLENFCYSVAMKTLELLEKQQHVPVAVAAAMGKRTPEEAAMLAEKGVYIFTATPGARERAKKVGMLAARISGQINE